MSSQHPGGGFNPGPNGTPAFATGQQTNSTYSSQQRAQMTGGYNPYMQQASNQGGQYRSSTNGGGSYSSQSTSLDTGGGGGSQSYPLQTNANAYAMQQNTYMQPNMQPSMQPNGMASQYTMYQQSSMPQSYTPQMMNTGAQFQTNGYGYSSLPMNPMSSLSMQLNPASMNAPLGSSMPLPMPLNPTSSHVAAAAAGASRPIKMDTPAAPQPNATVAAKIEAAQARKRKKPGTGSSRSRADADARANRIRKHNEAEVRRRQRLKCLLTELSEVVECGKTHKSAILRAAIERVKILSSKLQEFGVNVSELMATADHHAPEEEEEEEEPEETTPARQTRGSTKKALESAAQSTPNGLDGAAESPNHSDADVDHAAMVKLEQHPSVISNVTAASNYNSTQQPASSSVGSQSTHSRAPSPDANGHILKKQRTTSNGDAIITASNINGQQQHALPSLQSQHQHQQLAQSQHPYPSQSQSVSPSPILGVNHHALFHAAQAPMDIIDHAGNILDCNEAFAKFTGYSRSILINPGTTFLGLTHPDSLNASYKLMSGLISGKHTVTRARKKYVTNTGVIRNCIVTCWLVQPNQLSPDGRASPLAAGSGGPLIQAMIEEIPVECDLDDAYFELPYVTASTGGVNGVNGQPRSTNGTLAAQPSMTQVYGSDPSGGAHATYPASNGKATFDISSWSSALMTNGGMSSSVSPLTIANSLPNNAAITVKPDDKNITVEPQVAEPLNPNTAQQVQSHSQSSTIPQPDSQPAPLDSVNSTAPAAAAAGEAAEPVQATNHANAFEQTNTIVAMPD